MCVDKNEYECMYAEIGTYAWMDVRVPILVNMEASMDEHARRY
jgi:hypothetical protein